MKEVRIETPGTVLRILSSIFRNASAFEPRFKACVSWGAIWDYHATWKKRVDKAFQASLSVPGEHIMWVLGVSTIDDALAKAQASTEAAMKKAGYIK